MLFRLPLLLIACEKEDKKTLCVFLLFRAVLYVFNYGKCRRDFTFLGWSENADASGTQYAAGANYTVTQITTLYAVWRSNPNPFIHFIETMLTYFPKFLAWFTHLFN